MVRDRNIFSTAKSDASESKNVAEKSSSGAGITVVDKPTVAALASAKISGHNVLYVRPCSSPPGASYRVRRGAKKN
jgi:hypothetical protein